jgi:hypothetical protein
MHMFFDEASEREYTLKSRLVEAIVGTTEDLAERFIGRQWRMAATDLACIAYLAEVSGVAA